jgi:hypothetical protein
MSSSARSVFVQVGVLYLVVIGAAVFAGRDWIGWVFVAMLVFAVLNPIARAFGGAWWAETALSGAAFFAIVPFCSVTPTRVYVACGDLRPT